MAPLVGPGGAVHAVEANPALVSLLERSKRVNGYGWLKVHPEAVADVAGTMELQIQQSSGVSFLGSAHQRRQEDKVVRVARVRVTTLDSLVPVADRPRVAAIKIDVEGRELEVLRGSEEVLKAGPAIIIELVDSNLSRFGHTCQEVVEFLQARAYFGEKVAGSTDDYLFTRRP